MRIVLMALLVVVPGVRAQEKPAPGGQPPALSLASAAEQDGKVVIQIARPGVPVPSADPMEKPVKGLVWVNLRLVTLGESVHAFGVDGKRVEPKAVLTALAEPKGVAVFLRSYPTDPKTPPEFYRGLLREGTILLVANAEDLYNPKP